MFFSFVCDSDWIARTQALAAFYISISNKILDVVVDVQGPSITP